MISYNAENSITKTIFKKKRLTMHARAIFNFFKAVHIHKKVNFVEGLGF
jgi:hypothetical protein